jgi:hypothetical protein
MTSRLSNKFPIPEGFPEILHDFAKEVVRYQPNDIFDFAIQYFNSIEIERPLNYIPGGSANIERKEEKINDENINEENIKEENINKEKINDENINEENIKEENINEENIEDNKQNNDESAKDFVDGVFKESMNFVRNSQEKKYENDEENNLNRQENVVLESENNEGFNEENIVFGKTIMNTQGSDSKSNSRLSASSISNNSELMKTAHHFIGDVLKLGNENAKNNENV